MVALPVGCTYFFLSIGRLYACIIYLRKAKRFVFIRMRRQNVVCMVLVLTGSLLKHLVIGNWHVIHSRSNGFDTAVRRIAAILVTLLKLIILVRNVCKYVWMAWPNMLGIGMLLLKRRRASKWYKSSFSNFYSLHPESRREKPKPKEQKKKWNRTHQRDRTHEIDLKGAAIINISETGAFERRTHSRTSRLMFLLLIAGAVGALRFSRHCASRVLVQFKCQPANEKTQAAVNRMSSALHQHEICNVWTQTPYVFPKQ